MAFLDVAIADAIFGEDNEFSQFKKDTSLGHSLLGGDQEDAIEQAQQAQLRLGRAALATQLESQKQFEETLAPFVQFGSQLTPQVQQLFGPDVASSVSKPLLDFNQFSVDQINANPLLATVDQSGLPASQLISNIPLVSRERGDLLSAIGLGQASASQTGAGALETGRRRADLLTQLGNVSAAGGIAQANVGSQRSQNIVGLGTGLASSFFGGDQ